MVYDLLFCLSSWSWDSCFSFTIWSSSAWACFNSESIFATDSASEYCRVLNWLYRVTDDGWVILYESYKSKVWLGVIKFLDVYKISIFSPGHIDSSGISNPSFQVLSFLLSMLLTYSHFPVLDFASVKLFHLEIRIDWLLQQWSWLQLHPEWVFLLNDTLANEAPTWKAASRRRSKFEEKSTVFYLYLLIDCFVMLQLSFQISWWYLSDCLVGRWRCWWRWTCSR